MPLRTSSVKLRLLIRLRRPKANSIFAKSGYTDKEAKRNILSNLFKRFEDMNMMRHTKMLSIIVLNTHTHCLRGIEQYQGRFICYGLGNFCFGANRNPSDKDTMIYQQTWTFVDGVLQPDIDVHVEPCLISSTPGRNDYCPTTLTGSEYERVLANINAYSAQFGTRFDENGDYVPG